MIVGGITILVAALIIGLAAASIHHRRGGEDERLGP
jgi:hypothetical protein